MSKLWVPAGLICRVCRERFPLHRVDEFQRHVTDCVERHADYVDSFRTDEAYEGDPELGAFARAEGDVYNRRPGTRKRPR